MLRKGLGLSIMLVGVGSLVLCAKVQGQDRYIEPSSSSTPSIIITPVPAPQEVIVEPQGYVNCTSIPAGWYQNQWVPERRVCQYTPNNTTIKDEVWIAPYWACTQYKVTANSQGECTNWEWRPAHWGKSNDRY